MILILPDLILLMQSGFQAWGKFAGEAPSSKYSAISWSCYWEKTLNVNNWILARGMWFCLLSICWLKNELFLFILWCTCADLVHIFVVGRSASAPQGKRCSYSIYSSQFCYGYSKVVWIIVSFSNFICLKKLKILLISADSWNSCKLCFELHIYTDWCW